VFLIHEAIANEKNRLVRSIIIRMQQENASTSKRNKASVLPPDITFKTTNGSQSKHELDATYVVDKIGSDIRIGEPYIDVTKLQGIENAEAVTPRSNRGGHHETFPQVRRKKPAIHDRSSYTLLFSPSPIFTEAPPHVKGRSRYSRRQHCFLSTPWTSISHP
jgi:hypothetical protein